MRSAALAAALLVPAMALGQTFASSGWLDAARPRAAPDSRYAGRDCAGPAASACRLVAWREFLTSRGEVELSAPAGGRSYRFMIDRYSFGLGLKVMRLDVDAAGEASLTSSYPRRPAAGRRVPADVLAAFDAALATSKFSAAGAKKIGRAACEGDETIFEAVVGGRYKLVIEPCGDEAGLDKAMAVLDGQG